MIAYIRIHISEGNTEVERNRAGGVNTFYHVDTDHILSEQGLAIQCASLNCSYNCKENGTKNYVCFCQSGYTIRNDAKNCEGERVWRKIVVDASTLRVSRYS